MSAAEPAFAAPQPGSGRSSDPLLRWLPAPAGLVVIVIAAVFVMTVSFHGLTDVDYFWHVTTGRLIATHGLPASDPFSFTYGGPWTLHEWLGELLIYQLVHLAGGPLTLAFFGLIGGATVGVGVLTARRQGARVLPIAVAAAIAAGVLVSYLTVRPQAVSWLLLAVLVAFLLEQDGAHRLRVLWLIPFFVLWANLHGLYVVGLGILLIWLLATLLGQTAMAGAKAWALVGLVGAVIGSLVTPAGPGGIVYPLRYVQPGNWGLAHIQEWQSPNFHDPANIGLLLLTGALLLAGWRARNGWTGSPGWLGIAIAGLVVASLVSLRNAPLAAVASLPVLATSFDSLLPRRGAPEAAPRHAGTRRLMEAVLALVLIVATVAIFLPRVVSNEASAVREHLPVAGVDTLVQVNPRAHVFAEYGWGGYVIYRMYDAGGRVFVDGRNDMYPEQVLNDYSLIRDAGSDWEQKLDTYGADAILLPPSAGLVSSAGSSATWCQRYRDSDEVLLVRCEGGS